MKNNSNYYAGGSANPGYTPNQGAPDSAQAAYQASYGGGTAPMPMPGAPVSGGMDFDIGRLLKRLYRHWLILLLLWAGFSAFGVLNASKKPLTFYSSGMLSVGDDTGQSSATSMAGFGANTVSAFTQREVLRSTNLACEVIKANGLNARLSSPNALTQRKIMFRPLFMEWLRYSPKIMNYESGLLVKNSNTKEGHYYGASFRLKFTKSDTFQVLNGSGEFLQTDTLGKPVKLDEAEFTLEAVKCTMEPGDEVVIGISPDFLCVPGFLGSLQVNPLGGQLQPSNLIQIGYSADSPFVAKKVVDSVMEIYMANSLADSRRASQATAQYVANLMRDVDVELQAATTALESKQKEMGQFALDPVVQKLNDRMSRAEILKGEITRDMERLKGMEDLLKASKEDAKDDRNLVELEFFGDPDVRGAISVYRGAQRNLQQLEAAIPAGRPALAQARDEKTKAWEMLSLVVQSKMGQLQKGMEYADRELAECSKEFDKFPDQKRILADLMRKVDVHQKTHDQLYEEKSHADIAVESTISNCSVKSQAYPALSPSDPVWEKEVSSSAFLAFGFSALIVMLPGLRIRWFETAEEAARAVAQPVFAVLPSTGQRSRRGERKVLVQDPNSRWSESMRLLRTNLLQAMAGKAAQVLMVSGAQPGDGKSTVAANLAASLSQSSRVKSVLLIDSDMHRPSLHGVFGTPQSPGLSDYLNGTATIEQVLHQVEVPGTEGRTMAFIPAGPIPPVPSDLVDTEAMQTLLAYAREKYTFTVLDTPPYPLVSVAGALAEHVDRVLTVCRIGRTSRGLYLRHVTSLARHGAQIGQIFNSPSAGRIGSAQDGYGYGDGDGYGYGYGYGAGYGKGYGYGAKEKKKSESDEKAGGAPGADKKGE